MFKISAQLRSYLLFVAKTFLVFYFLHFAALFMFSVTTKVSLFSSIGFFVIDHFRESYFGIVTYILQLLHYKIVLYDKMTLAIAGTGGVKMVYACLGFDLYAMTIALFVSFPVIKFYKVKKYVVLVFLLIMIYFLNIIRIGLIMVFSDSDFFNHYDHHTIFNGLIYLITFLMFYNWMKKNNIKSQK